MKKLLSLSIICTIFLAALPAIAQDQAFSDVPDDHPNRKAIIVLALSGIITGNPDGTFRPDAPINRAELTKVVVGSKVTPKATYYKNCFPDVEEEWFAPYVCYALEQQWVGGYPDGTFRPANPVSNVEAIKIIFNGLRLNPSNNVTEPPFDDTSVDQWFTPYIAAAKKLNILEEQSGNYEPGKLMTRAKVAENLYRSVVVVEKILEQQRGGTSEESSTPPQAMDIAPLTGTHNVVLKTNKGDIALELNADKAPKTVTNFVKLSEKGYYNGLTFHRVIPDFMIQGGDPEGNGTGGTSIYGDVFEDEPNDIALNRGVIAMANRGPNTNGSQFFIIQKEGGTPWLQGKHTGFGHVTQGMDVIDQIIAVERGSNDAPMEPVTYTVEVVKG